MGENNDGAWSVLLGLAAGLGVGAAVGYALGELGREDAERVAYGRGLAEGRRAGFDDGAAYGREDAVLYPPPAMRHREEAARAHRVGVRGYGYGLARGREKGARAQSKAMILHASQRREEE